MTEKNRVLQSVETPDGGRCVDIFIRPDGSYGFEEYRRDVEDGRGWFPIGFHIDRVYPTETLARADARSFVSWLAQVERNDTQ